MVPAAKATVRSNRTYPAKLDRYPKWTTGWTFNPVGYGLIVGSNPTRSSNYFAANLPAPCGIFVATDFDLSSYIKTYVRYRTDHTSVAQWKSTTLRKWSAQVRILSGVPTYGCSIIPGGPEPASKTGSKGFDSSHPCQHRSVSMCLQGCYIDPKTFKCRSCGRSLQQVMDALKVPEKDQESTINWLIYRQYQ